MKGLKRVVSLALCAAMLLQMVPAALAEAFVSAVVETVQTENGTTLRSQVIDGNLVLDGRDSICIDGTITLRDGAIIVTGGCHEISRDAVIRGDIVVAAPAELHIDGIVEGNLYLGLDSWSKEYGTDSMPEDMYVEIGEHAVLHGLRTSMFMGFVHISGSVTSIEIGSDLALEMLPGVGTIQLADRAFADSVTVKGSATPHIQVMDDALVSRMSLSGSTDLYVEGARISELTAKDGANAYIHNGKITQLDVSGADTWISLSESQAGQITITNPSARATKDVISEWWNDAHAVVTTDKGTTVDSVFVSGLSSFSASNIKIDEAEAFARQSIDTLDREALFKETRIGTVVTSGPVCLENHAYMESVTMGRGGVMWGSGYTHRLEATDADVGFNRDCEEVVEELYHNCVRGEFNYDFYGGQSVGIAHLKGGNFSLSSGTGAQTVVAESADVNLCEFGRIENLVLSGGHNLNVAQDGAWRDGLVTTFGKEETIHRLFYNRSTWSVGKQGEPAMHIGTLSVFSNAMPAFGDIDRLLLPSWQKELSSGVTGDVALGLRPEPTEQTMEEPADGEPVEEEPQPAYYVGELVTTQLQKGEDLTDGKTSRSSAQKLRLQSYRIRKSSTRDWWYTVETGALETLTLSLNADEGIGMLVVYGPDGQLETLVSEGGSEALNVISEQGGAWTFRLIGAPNDYTLKLSVSAPIRVTLGATVQPANSKGNGKKTALDLTACSLEVENVTQGTFPAFLVTPEGIVMATDQAASGDTLRITLSDPEDAFIPVSAEVRLGSSLKAQARLETAEYGSYVVSCYDCDDVYMHLYDAEGAYVMTLPNTSGTFRADKLLPGTYQLVMIRGDVGRWRFTHLSDYAEFGLQEERDYRLDTFTLRKGYTDSYPGATVPAEPVLTSYYAVEASSRFDAAKSVCLEGGSVLIRAEYELENTAYITDCAVEIELSGMHVDPQAVMLNGSPVACTLEDDVLRIPVGGQDKGQIAFYASSADQQEMFAIARLRVQTAEGSEPAYLGFTALQKQRLSIHASPESGGTVNLFGYGVPGETVTLLRDGSLAGYADCDMNGKWNRTLHFDATLGYETYAFTAAVFAGTADELVSEPVSVRVQRDTPSLTGVELYYYEHEHQRKLTLSAEQFYRGSLSYSYLPGSAFTFSFTFDHSERIEALDLVLGLKTGDEVVIPCTYSEKTGAFTASGEFPRASMTDTIRLDWRLIPLPEPPVLDPVDEEETARALSFVPRMDSAILTDDAVEFDVTLCMDGETISTSSVCLEMGRVEIDMLRLQDEALASRKFEDGSMAFLMGEADQPGSVYLVFVSAEDATTYKLGNDVQANMLRTAAVRSGLIVKASADADDYAVLSQQMIAIGTMMLVDIVTGMAGAVVEVYTYDIMMAATYNLRNSVDTQWQQVLREIQTETSPKRLACLSELAAQYANLYQRCTAVADEYARKATVEGILAAVPDLISPEGLKAIRQFAKQSDELKGLRKVKQDTVDLYKTLVEKTQKNIDDQLEFLSLKGDYNALTNLKNWWTENADAGNKAIEVIEKAIQDGKPLSAEAQTALVDLLAQLASLGIEVHDLTEYTLDEIEMAKEMIKAVRQAHDEEMERQKAEELLREAQQELDEVDVQIEEETKNGMDTLLDYLQETINTIGKQYYEEFHQSYDEIRKEYEILKNTECEPDDEKEEEKKEEEKKPGIEAPNNGNPDPSGYVYEAMWSNRIEGVTATAYTRDATGTVVLWDAEPYDQENPTLTDAQGYYEWYVPEGDWMVTYEKEGYETAQSDWMVVPPPQTEVHQSIVSYEAPHLVYAAHYGEEVELAFSKPVCVESVSEETVSIGAGFTARAENPERYGDTDTVLATVFRLSPAGSLPRAITVAVSGGVTSYAGVPCEETSLECMRMARLTGLSAPAAVQAKTGENLTLTVQAQGGDFECYALEVTGAHEDLMRIDSIGAFDAEGRAIIELMPLAPGAVLLDIRVTNTDVEMMVKITTED